MILYKTTLHPSGRFVTPIRGDTLFGQLCWSIVHKFGKERLESLLEDYESSPFLVVSDGFTPEHLPKPTLPSRLLGESPDEKKTNRKKVWMAVDDLANGRYDKAKTDRQAGFVEEEVLQMHNSLNYKTFRTDKGAFAPYGAVERVINAKEVYLLLDESRLGADELFEALKLTGQVGYGKESGIGKGRFGVDALQKAELPAEGTTFMTLSPVSIEGTDASKWWYEPFTRFGKHGDARAKRAPFKRPLLLADTGAVVRFDEKRKLSFVGKGLRGVSPAHPDTVHQGYAITVALQEVAV